MCPGLRGQVTAFHKLSLVALGFLAPLVPPGISADETKAGDRRKSIERVVERIKTATVIIHATTGKPGEEEARTRSGLGVLVDPQGIVVLPRRLIEGASSIEVVLNDNRKLTPKADLSDRKAEWGLIQLESDKPFLHAEWADSDQVKLADTVLALGELQIELGIISRKRRAADTGKELFSMDSALSVPVDRDLLFNMDGRIIGVWTQAGAVPGNRVKEAVSQLLKKK